VDVEGGREVIEECHMRVKLEGKLLPGQTFVSKPGRLPCQAVIHAVGPMWRGGKHNEENHLYAAVSQSMQEASQRSYQTIAVPAISAGIFGFPVMRAAEIILTASRDFLADAGGTCLKDVYVVDNDPEVINSFETSLKSMTLPSQPGPEEEPHEHQARRVRSQKSAEQTQNLSGGEFTVYCCLLVTSDLLPFLQCYDSVGSVQEGQHLACEKPAPTIPFGDWFNLE